MMKVFTMNPLWTQLLAATHRFFPIFAPVTIGGLGNHAGHIAEKIGPYSLVQFAHQGDLVQQGIPGQGGLVKAHRAGQIDAIALIKGAIKAGLVPATALTDSAYLRAVETSFLLHYWFHNSEI